jgi:hypothetical protein
MMPVVMAFVMSLSDKNAFADVMAKPCLLRGREHCDAT